MQDFLRWCILAYECGYGEEDVRLQLTAACDASRSQVPATQVESCIEGACIVWLTLQQCSKAVTRWSERVPPLSLLSSGMPVLRCCRVGQCARPRIAADAASVLQSHRRQTRRAPDGRAS